MPNASLISQISAFGDLSEPSGSRQERLSEANCRRKLDSKEWTYETNEENLPFDLLRRDVRFINCGSRPGPYSETPGETTGRHRRPGERRLSLLPKRISHPRARP